MPDITIDSNTPKNDILRYAIWSGYKVLDTYDNRILDTFDNALQFLSDPPSTTPSKAPSKTPSTP